MYKSIFNYSIQSTNGLFFVLFTKIKNYPKANLMLIHLDLCPQNCHMTILKKLISRLFSVCSPGGCWQWKLNSFRYLQFYHLLLTPWLSNELSLTVLRISGSIFGFITSTKMCTQCLPQSTSTFTFCSWYCICNEIFVTIWWWKNSKSWKVWSWRKKWALRKRKSWKSDICQ